MAEKPQKRADIAYDQLLKLITSGRLSPSQRLTELTLCEQLGMSRTPVREALNRLVADGLLTSRPHRGITVRELTDAETFELYYVREAFESEAVRLAARRVADDELAELYAICGAMDEVDWSDPEEAVYVCRELDRQFHQRLVELSGVQVLVDMYNQHHILQLQLFGRHWTRLPHVADAYRREDRGLGERHRELVDALATRDPETADRAIRASVQEAIVCHREIMVRFADQAERAD